MKLVIRFGSPYQSFGFSEKAQKRALTCLCLGGTSIETRPQQHRLSFGLYRRPWAEGYREVEYMKEVRASIDVGVFPQGKLLGTPRTISAYGIYNAATEQLVSDR